MEISKDLLVSHFGYERVVSQEVSGPRRAVWDQADMQVRVSWEDDGDCNVGKMRGRV